MLSKTLNIEEIEALFRKACSDAYGQDILFGSVAVESEGVIGNWDSITTELDVFSQESFPMANERTVVDDAVIASYITNFTFNLSLISTEKPANIDLFTEHLTAAGFSSPSSEIPESDRGETHIFAYTSTWVYRQRTHYRAYTTLEN